MLFEVDRLDQTENPATAMIAAPALKRNIDGICSMLQLSSGFEAFALDLSDRIRLSCFLPASANGVEIFAFERSLRCDLGVLLPSAGFGSSYDCDAYSGNAQCEKRSAFVAGSSGFPFMNSYFSSCSRSQ